MVIIKHQVLLKRMENTTEWGASLFWPFIQYPEA